MTLKTTSILSQALGNVMPMNNEQVWESHGFQVQSTGSSFWAAVIVVRGVEFWFTDASESQDPDPNGPLLVGAYLPNSGIWLDFSIQTSNLAEALISIDEWAEQLQPKLTLAEG